MVQKEQGNDVVNVTDTNVGYVPGHNKLSQVITRKSYSDNSNVGIKPLGKNILIKNIAMYNAYTFFNILASYNAQKEKKGVVFDVQYSEVIAIGDEVTKVKVGDLVKIHNSPFINVHVTSNDNSFKSHMDRFLKENINITPASVQRNAEVLVRPDIDLVQYTIEGEFSCLYIIENKEEFLETLKPITSSTALEKLSQIAIQG